MAYNINAWLGKLVFSTCVDFGGCHDRSRQFVWSNNDSKYLYVKLKVFKRYHNKEFGVVQNVTRVEAEFNQFMRLRNQVVIEAENFAQEETLSPVRIPRLSKVMDEQVKLAHNVVDVVDQANNKIYVTLLWYSVNQPKSSYTQVQLFARKKEDEMFQ